MSESSQPEVIRCWLGFAGFYTCSFAVLGIYMQFLPVWLHEVQGFDADDIAVILAAQTISRTVAGPFWSNCVDRTGNARRVLIWLSAGGAGAFSLFAWAPTLATAWCVAFVFGCLYPPMHPIADAAAVRAANRLGFSFGRLRVMGSSSFLVIILLAGSYLERHGTSHVYGMVLVALAVTALAAWFVPRDHLHVPQAKSDRTPWWHLFRSKSFVILMISAALIQGSHATYYQQSTVYWNAHGIDNSTAALLWAEGVLAEIVLLFFAKNTLEKLRPTTLLLLGGSGAIVRWIVIGSTTSLPWLFATNWLHALSFAATYLGAIRAVERRVPVEQRATAQGVIGAAQAGGGMVFCGLIGGFTFKHYQGQAFYFMAGFAAVGVVLAMWLRRVR
jgi:PPP family 3-phenylpropionic acid transporter